MEFTFGDKENHKLNFHPVQISYFSLFAIALLPNTISEFKSTAQKVVYRIIYTKNSLASLLIILAINIIIIDQFT